jgi:hypothetical protein
MPSEALAKEGRSVAPASPRQPIAVCRGRESDNMKLHAACRQTGTKALGIVRLVSPTDINSPGIHELFRYWERKRGARCLPAKAEIDPAEIKSLLPNITVTEIHRAPLRVHFRLVGTEVARATALDFTDTWLPNAGWGDEIETATLSIYQRVIEAAAPVFGVDDFVWRDGRRQHFEWGKFPLTSDGETITHTIGFEDHRYPAS